MDLELWAVLMPILLADVVNPVLFAPLIYSLGSSRPVARASGLLLGHTVAYFAAGVGLSLGLASVAERLANPRPVDFVVEGVAGLALLGVGTAMATGKQAEERHDEDDVQGFGLAQAFVTGSTLGVVGIPFAVPYLGAVSQILKAPLSDAGMLAVLAIYNLLYALPFALVVAARALMGERVDGALRRINEGMKRASAVLVPLVLLGLGALFVADSVVYWMLGEPLIQL